MVEPLANLFLLERSDKLFVVGLDPPQLVGELAIGRAQALDLELQRFLLVLQRWYWSFRCVKRCVVCAMRSSSSESFSMAPVPSMDPSPSSSRPERDTELGFELAHHA